MLKMWPRAVRVTVPCDRDRGLMVLTPGNFLQRERSAGRL
jgi:hypothetical protein